jgi:hypothetical protein
MATTLPTPFADLEVFVADWSLATQRERERQRAVSTAGELTTLYQVLLPRLDAMLEYLNQYELDKLPADAKRLFYLSLSFAEIAPFVECYKGEPRVPNSFDESRFIAIHADRLP